MNPRDPYKYFRIEARELLEGLRRGVTGLDAVPADPGLIPLLLRLAHTLKGAARVVRLPAVSDLAHRLEDLLAPCRESPVPPPPALRADLRRLIEEIATHLAAIDLPTEIPADTPGTPPAATPVLLDTVRLQAAEVESALSGVAGTAAELATLRGEFRAIDRAGGQARRVLALSARIRTSGVEGTSPSRLTEEAGELATTLEGTRRRLDDRAERIGRDLQRLHEDTSRLRLIPVEALWSYLEHGVHDAAQTLGRRVRLETASRTPRLDTPVFAGLQEALLHLTRNAVAHGIEPEAGRRAAGKPPVGCVRLHIAHRCDRLRIVCEDDGGGIDTAAVRRAAVAKGWLTEKPAPALGMAEAIALLLRGGVTTSGPANQMSGRGVGLDAVRAAVARLGGQMEIQSSPGRGTSVTLEVPVTLSAVEVLIVAAGDIQWLLPLASVRTVLRTEPGDIRRSDRGEELHAGGQVRPYAALQRLVSPSAPAQPGRIAVVLDPGDESGACALGVERLLGTGEAIVRPMPLLADAVAFAAGASLEADGLPRPVADAAQLAAAIRAAGAVEIAPAPAHAPILIVDDSLTTRMLEQSILESAGFTVDVAVSGEEALRRLRERRYGLLLVDVEMPGMDGFTLIEKLRADPAWRDLPAILVTSRESREDRQRGSAVGAQDYVVKGEFDQRRLLQRIGELLP